MMMMMKSSQTTKGYILTRLKGSKNGRKTFVFLSVCMYVCMCVCCMQILTDCTNGRCDRTACRHCVCCGRHSESEGVVTSNEISVAIVTAKQKNY